MRSCAGLFLRTRVLGSLAPTRSVSRWDSTWRPGCQRHLRPQVRVALDLRSLIYMSGGSQESVYVCRVDSYCAVLVDVERYFFGAPNDLHCWEPRHVPKAELVEHVWIVKRKIGNHKSGFQYVL